MTVSEALSQFIAGIKFEDVPGAVIGQVKDHFLDTLGASLGAYRLDSTDIVTDYLVSLGGSKKSTIIGRSDLAPAPMAAFANGVMAHGLELNDYYLHTGGHPGPYVCPPALALAEANKADGKTLLLSMLIGYEICVRMVSVMRKANARGFYVTSICGIFGATAAAGKVLGLNPEQMGNALGIAGNQLAGLRADLKNAKQLDGSLKKPFHVGWSCLSGVFAAELAKRGYTAPYRTILDPGDGVLRAYGDIGDEEAEVARGQLLTGLGTAFALPKVSFRLWAAAPNFQGIMEACAAVASENNIATDDIEEVTIAVPKQQAVAVERIGPQMYEPPSRTAAQYAIPYQAAVAMVHRRPTVESLTDEGLKDPKVIALAKRIKFVPDHSAEAVFPIFVSATVTVKLKGGKTHAATRVAARGDYPLLLNREELTGKFRMLASPVVGEATADKIIETVDNLEKLKDVNELTRLLRKQ